MLEVEIKNGRPHRPSEFQLKPETDLMVDSMSEWADELGLNPVHLMRCIMELRRENVDYEKALSEVVIYLRSE